MSFPILSEENADTVGKGVFLIGLGVLFLLNFWWPGILLVILAAMGVRHFLLGKFWELAILVALFVLLFVISFYHIEEMYIIPALLVIGGAYFIVRAFVRDNNDRSNFGGGNYNG